MREAGTPSEEPRNQVKVEFLLRERGRDLPMLGECRADVDAMLSEGMRFSEVEDRINAMPLDDERRAALWLYAAAHSDRDVFFHALRPGLAGVGG